MNAAEFKGRYAQKQLYSKAKVVAWSHRSRFEMARKLIAPFAGQRLLDYGCGDGTFLQMVAAQFPGALGVDASPPQNADCEARLGGLNGLSFKLIKEMSDAKYDGAFELIVCMEVLEHCPDDAVEKALADLKRLAAPGARILVSVPIEIGPTLIFKQMLRVVAGWRKIGDYKWTERYTWGELLKMCFAGARTSIARPLHRDEWTPGDPYTFHTHKGFNWRRLRNKLKEKFEVSRTRFTPLGWLGGYVSSQAWFLCENKAE